MNSPTYSIPRLLSLFVMMVAVGAVVVLRSELPQKKTQELAARNMEFMGKLLVSEVVLAKAAPEPERKMRTGIIIDQLKTLESRGLFSSSSLDVLALKYQLGQKVEGIPADSEAGRVFNGLYSKHQIFPDDAAMFQTPAGQLLRIQNLRNQGKEEEAKKLETELHTTASKREIFMTLGVFAGGTLFAMGLAAVIIFFSRHPPVRFFPVVQSFGPIDHSQLLDTFVVYLFLMFPVAYFVGGFVPEAHRMTFQALWIPAVFFAALLYHSKSTESNMLRALVFGPDPVGISGVVKEIAWGIGGFVVIFPLAFAAFALSPALADEQHNAFKFAHPAVFALKDHFWLTAGLAVGIVPWCEEIMFRSFAYGYLRRFMRLRFAAFATGVVFAALHPQGMVAVPYLTVLGTGLAALREFRPGVIASVTAHSMVNGLAVTAAYFVLN